MIYTLQSTLESDAKHWCSLGTFLQTPNNVNNSRMSGDFPVPSSFNQGTRPSLSSWCKRDVVVIVKDISSNVGYICPLDPYYPNEIPWNHEYHHVSPTSGPFRGQTLVNIRCNTMELFLFVSWDTATCLDTLCDNSQNLKVRPFWDSYSLYPPVVKHDNGKSHHL